jgi:transcriptional regulator with XRE-family HTH domain
MQKRTVNSALLRKALRNRDDRRVKTLAEESSVSVSWLEKALSGNYECVPRALTRKALCSVTNLSEDKLFPLVGASESEAS